jgi:hypothetical protein
VTAKTGQQAQRSASLPDCGASTWSWVFLHLLQGIFMIAVSNDTTYPIFTNY